MKKIMAFVLLLFSIFIINGQASEETFRQDWYASGVYVKWYKDGVSPKYAEFRSILRTRDGHVAYCLEPFKTVSTSINYHGQTTDFTTILGITKETWEDIELIMLYGYGYGNHTEYKWYAITQMLIWSYVDPSGHYEYTSSYAGTSYERFTTEKEEILSLVREHKVRPSFVNQTFKVGLNEERTITDTNLRFSTYDISSNSGVKATKEGNNVILKGLQKGRHTLVISKEYEGSEYTTLYTDPDGEAQTLAVQGKLNTYGATLTVDVIAGNIKVNIKRGEDYYSNCDNGKKTTYGLYDGDTLIETFDATTAHNYLSKDLPPKKYTIKQLTAACNDKVDNNVYEVEIKEDALTPKVDIMVEENYKDLKIIKKYGNELNKEYHLEEGAVFAITDGNYTKTYTTNANGEVTIRIGYGTYTLKQTKGKTNYAFAKEQTILVNDSTLSTYQIDLINEEILGSITVDIERGEDYYSNCSNNLLTTYGLFERDTNTLIKTFDATSDGRYTIPNLSLKKYYVKQLTAACNDLVDEKEYEVEIKEKNLNPEVKVKVEEYYKEITLTKKYGSYLDEKYTLEKDAVFEIGDSNAKFTLTTNSKGNAKIKLGYGVYTLKQVLGKDGYELIADQTITINQDTLDDYKIELINEEILSNIKVVVKDEEGNLLKDVLVGLYKGTKKVLELYTNELGEVYFSNLSLRDYTIKQLSIPEGYEEVSNSETVTLTDEDALVVFYNKRKLSVVDTPKNTSKSNEVNVPDTYVDGDGKIIKVSSILLSVALYTYIYGKKRYN